MTWVLVNLHTLTTAPLVSSIGTVLVSVTLQSLWETLTYVPTGEVAEGTFGGHFWPAGQQR